MNMLTLKIMSAENKADSDPDKEYRIIGGIKEIRIRRTRATKHECKVLGLKCLLGVLGPQRQIQEWSVCIAECSFPDAGVPSNYLLDGNCYVLNDEGHSRRRYFRKKNYLIKLQPFLVKNFVQYREMI